MASRPGGYRAATSRTPGEKRRKVVTVAEAAAISDISHAFIAVAQQVAGFHQAHPIKIALWRQTGLLLQLAVQRTQRQRKLRRHLLPADLLRKMVFEPANS